MHGLGLGPNKFAPSEHLKLRLYVCGFCGSNLYVHNSWLLFTRFSWLALFIVYP